MFALPAASTTGWAITPHDAVENANPSISKLCVIRANQTIAPNNGVILSYGNSDNWVGQLYIGDNSTQGIYYKGCSDGSWGEWIRLLDENSTVSWADSANYANSAGSVGSAAAVSGVAGGGYRDAGYGGGWVNGNYYYLPSGGTWRYIKAGNGQESNYTGQAAGGSGIEVYTDWDGMTTYTVFAVRIS